MQASARAAAAALAHRAALLQAAVLPSLTFQLTSLTSLAGGLAGRSGNSVDARWSPCGALAAAAASGGSCQWHAAGALILPVPQQLSSAASVPTSRLHHAWRRQQRRPIFNFAGFGGDLCKSHHEKKLLGWVGGWVRLHALLYSAWVRLRSRRDAALDRSCCTSCMLVLSLGALRCLASSWQQ